MKYFVISFLLLAQQSLIAQTYTSYFTGNSTDVVTIPQGGTCMMGGASEHDGAMQWFLERANGGDVLILRASGSDGYNDYFYSELGVTINSAETIVFNAAAAANESYIHEKINNAEAIWFAGGDQWDYISYWRNTPIGDLINDALHNRNIVIGGTSAGMAILGNYYFSASNGTVTSGTAINNPYDTKVTVDSSSFLDVNYMHDVITDTHYDDPDRKGRHIVFLARILTDYGVAARGIACNEYTAVCIDDNGIARVFGEYPEYPETAFFLQTNCELPDFTPEACTPSTSLEWNLNGSAIRVYKVNGTNEGTNTFDLKDWKTGNGGTWENWYINAGTLNETIGTQIDCATVSVADLNINSNTKVYPNPFENTVNIEAQHNILALTIIDVNGQICLSQNELATKNTSIKAKELPQGTYFIQLQTVDGIAYLKLIKI